MWPLKNDDQKLRPRFPPSADFGVGAGTSESIVVIRQVRFDPLTMAEAVTRVKLKSVLLDILE